MNTCPEKIVDSMHAYLDGEIDVEEELVLMEHLKECSACNELMTSMSEAITFVENAALIQAPMGFVDGVMKRLPKEKSQAGFQRFLRRHPLFAAAAMFLLLMSVSVFSSFGNNDQFSVTKQPNLVVEGETVLVPENETVKGDILVKNGNLRVEGEVDGDITVINGSKYMASTAVVTGNIEEIDQAFDWLWYKIKQTGKDIFSSSKKDELPDE